MGIVALDQHLLAAGCDVHHPGTDFVAVLRLLDLEPAYLIEAVGKRVGKRSRHVLNHEHRQREACRQRGQHFLKCHRPACRGADGQQTIVGQVHAGCARRCFRSRLRITTDHPCQRRGAGAPVPQRPHAKTELRYGFFAIGRDVLEFLGKEIHRAGIQCIQRGAGTLVGERRKHQDRRRPGSHDFTDRGDAVHDRHLDVHGNHIGL